MRHLQRRFNKTIDSLYETNHYLAAEITKLGYPKLVQGYPPTAGVMWDKELNKICFIFNANFFKKLTDEELSFVIAHEARHVIGGHIFHLRDEVDKLQRLNEPNKEINKFVQKFNVAADCVVNDSLVNLYKFPQLENIAWMDITLKEKTTVKELSQSTEIPVHLFYKLNNDINNENDILEAGCKIKKPFIPIYGKPLVKMECHDLTAMEVYYLLPEQKRGSGEVENHEGWRSFTNEDGSLDESFVDSIKDFVEKNLENSALSDEEMAEVDKIKETMEESLDEYVAKAGKEATSVHRSVGPLGNESLKWNKILSTMVETKKIEDIWSRPNRKLSGAYPDVILPTTQYTDAQEILLFIDASYSIDLVAMNLFLTILKNSPGNLDITAVSFDTACYEYDINGKDPPMGGGGTYFHILEEYIQNNLDKYPQAVFVLTDGMGNAIEPQFPKKWCWILYGGLYNTYCKDMKHYAIEDLLA